MAPTARRRAPTATPDADQPPSKPNARRRAPLHSLTTAALILAAAVAAASWWTASRTGDAGAASVAADAPPRVTPADAAAAADELAAAAAADNAVDVGPSGYVTAAELEAAGHDEAAFRERAAAAVAGAYVADAATLGLHGVTAATVARLLADAGKTGTPEFWTPHAGPYEAEPGSFSAHGYETLPLLQSLLAANNFSASHYAAAAAAFFAATPGHVELLPAAWAPRAHAALAAGGSAARLGVPSPAASAVVKVPAVVARFGGTPRLRRALSGAVRVHQTDPAALAAAGAAAAVLERVIVLRQPLRDAVADAARCPSLSEAGRAMLAAGLARAAARAAAPPPDPPHPHGATAEHALATALDVALAHPTDYVAAVRASIVVGGDAAAPRAHVVGAWVAGAAGARPPPRWREAATKAVSVDAMVHLLLHQRGQRVPVAMPGQAVDDGEEVGRV